MVDVLYFQPSKWTRSYINAESMKTSPRDNVYERVKDATLSLENHLKLWKTKFTRRPTAVGQKGRAETIGHSTISWQEHSRYHRKAICQLNRNQAEADIKQGAKRCFYAAISVTLPEWPNQNGESEAVNKHAERSLFVFYRFLQLVMLDCSSTFIIMPLFYYQCMILLCSQCKNNTGSR